MAESIACQHARQADRRRSRQHRARGIPSETASAATSCRATSTAPPTILSTEDGSGLARGAPRPARRAALTGHPQGLDRDRRRLADRERGSDRRAAAVVRGLADPRDAGGHHPRRQGGRRLASTSRPTSSPGTSSGCSRWNDSTARSAHRTADRRPSATQRNTRRSTRMSLANIPVALEALSDGKPIIVADNEGRENEGDVIIAAESASQEWVAWMVRHTSGFICAPMTNEIADRLDLPPMVEHNQDPRGTAYTVSVDAADRLSTGISASDRAHTLRVLADPTATPAQPEPPGPHHAAARGGWRRARARRPHRGRGRPAEAGRARRRSRAISEIVARRRRDDAAARAHRARRARRRSGHHDRVADRVPGGEALRREIPMPSSTCPSRSRVTFEVETNVPTAARRVPGAGLPRPVRPAPTTSRRSRARRRTAPWSACTPSA